MAHEHVWTDDAESGGEKCTCGIRRGKPLDPSQPCRGNEWIVDVTAQTLEEKCSGCGLPKCTHKFLMTVLKFTNRVNRFRKLAMLGAPEIIMENERLLIQSACDDCPTTPEIRAQAKKIDDEIKAHRDTMLPK